MMTMKLSIGIPTYNQGKYIKQTLDSLLSQTIAPFEIVVSDNHCTDDTNEILQSYKEYIRVIKPEKHLSMMANWNFLIHHLKGDWFSLLSSDDIALPNFVSSLSEGISREPSAVLIRGGYEGINEESVVVSHRLMFNLEKVSSFPNNFYEQLFQPRVSFSAFAVKKTACLLIDGFPEECIFSGDWALWLKLSPLGSFVYVNEIISQYRIKTGFNADHFEKYLLDDIHIYQQIIWPIFEKYQNLDQSKYIKAFKRRLLYKMMVYRRHIDAMYDSKIMAIFSQWERSLGLNVFVDKFSQVRLIPRLIDIIKDIVFRILMGFYVFSKKRKRFF